MKKALLFVAIAILVLSMACMALIYAVAGNYQPAVSAANTRPALPDPAGSVQIDQLPRAQTLYLEGWDSSNPRDYDPATSTSVSGLSRVFSGLVSLDSQLQVRPDLAERWSISADGTVYTFSLNKNARFQDRKPVTAQDVIYSWERAVDPKMESPSATTYLGDIVGVAEMHAGQAEHISGLKALDEQTLQVTIDAPKPYFLLKITYPVAFVVEKANVESGPEWYRKPIGSGPFRLVDWQPLDHQLYVRNPDFYLPAPGINYILVRQGGGGLMFYEQDKSDLAGVGTYNIDRVQDATSPLHTQLRSGVSLCTSYVSFDVQQPPFDDPKVRQAFSMAFDRQQYISTVLNDASLPAVGVLPPGMPGFNAGLKGLPYDPEQARKLLAESKYGGAAGLPPITYTQGSSGSYVGDPAAALIQMWEQTLGVKIAVEGIDWNVYQDRIYAGHHGQIFDSGWCADYPDPENFLDLNFHTGSQANAGHYSNPQVDALLEQARVERDVQKRLGLYQQAEQQIVDDAPALFLVHGLTNLLVKPYLRGYVLQPIDYPFERYVWVDASRLP
jgi:oligopeptide transport system substrate-binding protein